MRRADNPVITGKAVDAFLVMASAPADQLADQHAHIPLIIYALIFILAMMAALVAGYAMTYHRTLPIIRIIVFAVAVGVTMYVIIDLEYPRTGFFNAVTANHMLAGVIEAMR